MKIRYLLLLLLHKDNLAYRALRKCRHMLTRKKKTLLGNIQACDILFQCENFLQGGLENVALDLMEVFRANKFNVGLLVLGKTGKAASLARQGGIPVYELTYQDDTYTRFLAKAGPKLVLSHYSTHGSALCALAGIPFVQVIHNTYAWFGEALRQDFIGAIQHTTLFIAVSDWVKEYSIKRLELTENKSVVIPNGIDLAPFRHIDRNNVRARLRVQHGIGDEEFVFLDMGAITYQKNHLGMIKAFEIAMHACGNSRMVILGPCYKAGLLREMMDYIAEHGLQGKVFYYGETARPYEYFAMADAFVSASFFEGGQLTFLEAIAANIPIVTSAVGFAANFKERQGIKTVKPVYDMISFSGAVDEMESTPEFEQRFAEAMARTWENPLRPDFSETELAALDKKHAYKNYIDLARKIMGRN